MRRVHRSADWPVAMDTAKACTTKVHSTMVSNSRGRSRPRPPRKCTAPRSPPSTSFCRAQGANGGAGKPFAELGPELQDAILHDLEDGKINLEGADAKKFFKQLLKDTQQGFFADPVYGGNRNMCAWKMIGFPGARYDYRDWVGRHNERYPHPPVSIAGRPDWTPS